MKRDIVKILRCPTCKGNLSLTVKKEDHEDIITGSFQCKTCNVTYPIEDGIPDLLPR